MKNTGITILQLVITIAIMLIILAISLFFGNNVSREANIASIYSEIKEIESVLNELSVLNKITIKADSISFYDEIDVPKVDKSFYSAELQGFSVEDCYLLDFTSSKKLENVLGLEKVDNNYLFDLNNLNIYLIGGLDVTDESGKIIIKYNSDEIVDYYSNTFVK